MSQPTSNLFPSLTYADAPAAIEWLCRAFGFTRRLVVPGPEGGVMHSELSLGPGVVMVSSPKPAQGRVAPEPGGGRSHALSLHITDPDAHHARAMAAGARILRELEDEEYGGRGYMVADPEGHIWYFGSYRPGEHWEDAAPAQ